MSTVKSTSTATPRGTLLTVVEVTGLLQVPTSWVYEWTRQRGLNRLLGFRLGKGGDAYRVQMTDASQESPIKLPASTREISPMVDFEGRSAELRRQVELIWQRFLPAGKEATA